MSTTSRPAPRRRSAARAARAAAGVVLIVFLHSSVASMALEMGSGGTAWRLVALASALLLLVASWRNWPLIWNPLGRALRSLVGERATRLAFGSMAVTFALFAMNSASASPPATPTAPQAASMRDP